MEDKTIAFNNLSMLIEDTEVIMNDIWFNKYDEESFFNAINNYFDKYEYKPNIVKGITSTIEFKPLLQNKNNHLKTLANELKRLSDKIAIKKVIDDDKSYLDFSIKSVIENRLNPLLNYVINEIELSIIEVKTTKTDEGYNVDLSDTKGTEKIIMLYKLGVLDFLKEKHPFISSVNSLASALSGVTGINQGTVQSYINPIFSNQVDKTKSPLSSEKSVKKVTEKLLSIGFKPQE